MNAHRLETQQQYQATQKGFQDLKKGQMRIRKQLLENTKAIGLLDEAQQSLQNRFVNQYGASSSSAPQTRFGANVQEDEILEDDENPEEEDEAQDEEENEDEEEEEVEEENAHDDDMNDQPFY